MGVAAKRPDDLRYTKVLFFGPPGHGKTYLLGTAQDDERTYPMLLLDFEGGYETLSGLNIDVVEIRSWDDYSEVYEILSGNDHSKLPGSSLEKGERYKSIGLDSISETHVWALLARIGDKADQRNDPDLIEQGDYGVVSTQLRRMLREFRDLPMHVFFTATSAQVQERKVGNVIKPAMAGKMADEVVGLVSVVGYLALTENDDGETERVLLLQNYPGFRTKARVPWEWVAPDEIENPTVTNLLDALRVGDSQPIVIEEDHDMNKFRDLGEEDEVEEVAEVSEEEKETEDPEEDWEDDEDVIARIDTMPKRELIEMAKEMELDVADGGTTDIRALRVKDLREIVVAELRSLA